MSAASKVRQVADPPVFRRLDTENNLRGDAYGRLWLAALTDAIRIVTEPLPMWVPAGASRVRGSVPAVLGRLTALERRLAREVAWLSSDGVALARALSAMGFLVDEDMVLAAVAAGRDKLLVVQLLGLSIRSRLRRERMEGRYGPQQAV